MAKAKAEEEEGFIHVHFAFTSQYPVSQNSFGIGIDHGVMRYALCVMVTHTESESRTAVSEG
jgi:hypothetical protein